jgi:polysaccharide export outer membrane protein
LRILYAPVLILLSVVGSAAFGQTTESQPRDNRGASRQQGQAPVDPNSPDPQSLITVPNLSELKGDEIAPGARVQAQTPTPTDASGQQLLPEYRIGAGDVLRISVWKEPEVSVDAVAVRSDGKISLPLIKEIFALGMAPADLERVLTNEFSHFINNPAVTVIVREINSQKIYLVGGVVRPGSLPLRTPMTVLQVLAEAGGLTDYAKRKKIYIIRKDSGRDTRIDFNYDAVLKGENAEQNIPVRAGDTIVVPE